MNQVRQALMPAKGFTVVELMVSIAVATILTAIALPNLRTFIENSRRDSTVDGLVASLNYARNQALDLDQPVDLCAGIGGAGSGSSTTTECASGGAWSAGWDVVTTPAGATTPQVLITHALSTASTTPSVAATNGNTFFQFNGNGTVTMTNAPELIVVCDSRGTSMARAIEINAAGYIQSSSTPGKIPAGTAITACPG